jgi:transcription antitermination factor NusG
MTTVGQTLQPARILPFPEAGHWFAVQTRSRHEKKVAAQLGGKGICHYLPLLRTVHKWTDRNQQVELPLFSGYAFVHLNDPWERRLDILRIPGVVRMVGTRSEPTPIAHVEIENIRRILAEEVTAEPFPYLHIGQRVRIRGGCLDGVHGILVCQRNRTLVVSVDAIQRSLAINIENYDVVAA